MVVENVLMPEPFLHGTVWSTEDQSADWFVGAADAASLGSAPCFVWDIDEVGKSFYDCPEDTEGILAKIKADAQPCAAADPARRGALPSVGALSRQAGPQSLIVRRPRAQ
jgi:hypothetical protein